MATPGKKVVAAPENVQVDCKTDVVMQGQNSGENKEEVALEIEPKTKISFPIKLVDVKQNLNTVGVCTKTFFGVNVKIYSFGIYMDNEKLKEVLKSKIRKKPEKPTKEMYQMVIDSNVETTIRMIFVRPLLGMSDLKKYYDEYAASSIKKYDGQKNPELAKKILGGIPDKTVLVNGSVIEISRLPGSILQTKALGEVVSNVESELLCRSHLYSYLGEDPIDKDAKEKFGKSLLSLF